MTRRAVVLFGHGSRDPAWREPMDAVARRITARAPGTDVICAFLELQSPDLMTAIAELAGRGAAQVRVLPMFLGVGKHAREDLPVLVSQARFAHPGLDIQILPAVGERPDVIDLLAGAALDGEP
jgi:sirohydrochlorin cobaltochelatase